MKRWLIKRFLCFKLFSDFSFTFRIKSQDLSMDTHHLSSVFLFLLLSPAKSPPHTCNLREHPLQRYPGTQRRIGKSDKERTYALLKRCSALAHWISTGVTATVQVAHLGVFIARPWTVLSKGENSSAQRSGVPCRCHMGRDKTPDSRASRHLLFLCISAMGYVSEKWVTPNYIAILCWSWPNETG